MYRKTRGEDWDAGSPIGKEELKSLLKHRDTLKSTPFVLLDVREPNEFADGHIEGSVNIPVGTLPKVLMETDAEDREKQYGVRLDNNDRIIVYCKMGGRSTKAQALFNALNFNK